MQTSTICPYCGVGCGVIATRHDNGAVSVRGDAAHPANYGRLCSKGAALGETTAPDGRLTRARLHGQEVALDEALTAVACGFQDVIDKHGPDAVAFYLSGQLLTEDYYVANKLMKGFIGSANVDTNSRLCMASSVAGHKRAFGYDSVPGCYQDLEQADLLVLVGSNMAWCHPVLYQRIMAARDTNPHQRIVVIDPRRTASCEEADLHLALKPGTDVALFNGLLAYLAGAGCEDKTFTAAHTDGLDAALVAARAAGADGAAIAGVCGLAAKDVETFYHWFGETQKVVTLFAEGVNQSSAGTDKVNAIINAHLFTGRIAKPGAGPFSLTGQSNAMGGREAGGLANQLAAHMALDNAAHRRIVGEFWGVKIRPDKPGLTAVDMFDAVHDGRVRAIWIMCTNPAVSLPDAGKVRAALEKCDLVVVSDVLADTDTGRLADVLLPAAPWGEKEGTVTNSERRISRMRSFLPTMGEAQPDWWLISQVAQKMGFGAAFQYNSAADIFREHAALSGYRNRPARLQSASQRARRGAKAKHKPAAARDFNISALAKISAAGWQEMTSVQWPVTAHQPTGTARLFTDGAYYTASGKAQFVATPVRGPQNPVSADWPFVLNTGRIRDQWHTMTRTARAPQLNGHMPEPLLVVHPDDARESGLAAGDITELRSRWGASLFRVTLSDEQRCGELFAPMHWTDRLASHARTGLIVNPAVDPVSHQPESKHTPVRLKRLDVAWHGFLLSRRLVDTDDFDYWARADMTLCHRYELAGFAPVADWPATARRWLCASSGGGARRAADWIEYSDPGTGHHRFARFDGGRLDACLFIARTPHLPSREWLISVFADNEVSGDVRSGILAGRPLDAASDKGEIVCSCFQVGRNQIVEAMRTQNCTSVEQIGACLNAGTNCGSCKPEIARLLQSNR